MKLLNIGVLAFQGDVIEHIEAVLKSAKKIRKNVKIFPVRTKKDLRNLNGLIIPGGESTTIQKLCEREQMLGEIKKIKNIFGTCAGTIILANLKLLNIEVERNAYGRQTESFEKDIKSTLGNFNAIFIRAPKIKKITNGIDVLAKDENEILAVEQKDQGKYYLAACFHPELTTTIFHEYFLKHIN